MSALEFISSLIWPIVVLIIVLIFRTPIMKLIANITMIKYKGIEFVIGDKIKTPEGIFEVQLQPKLPVEKSEIRKLSADEIEQSRQNALNRLQEDTARVGEKRGELYQLDNGKWGISWEMAFHDTVRIKG